MSTRQLRINKAVAGSLFVLTVICLAFSSYGVSLPTVPLTLPGEVKWREAAAGYQFTFPRDHAAHPDYRVEWWYYTGNLESQSGRKFGYQLTFFRVGVMRGLVIPSRWAIRDLYMAHFAVTDVQQNSFRFFERINRAGLGWAGADSIDEKTAKSENDGHTGLRVWNEDWEAHIGDGSQTIRATEGNATLNLQLTPLKREVINGENGVSRKGPLTENASHYLSLTRLETTGQLVIDGQSLDVKGLSWMDHEFGTSFLYGDEVGWDWFSIHLDDQRDLMICRIRGRDGSIDPHSSGTLIEPDGRSIHLGFEDFKVTPGEIWQSKESGARYPIGWKIELPKYQLELSIAAALDDQELRTAQTTGVNYWEGAILVLDSGKKVLGNGYLEMTGYAGENMGKMFR